MANWVRYPLSLFGAFPPWRACEVEVRYPPLKRGISAILARYPMKTRQMGAIPPSAILSRKGIARYGGVSCTGPVSLERRHSGMSEHAAMESESFSSTRTFRNKKPLPTLPNPSPSFRQPFANVLCRLQAPLSVGPNHPPKGPKVEFLISLAISILLEMFNLDLQNSPAKNRVWWVTRLKCSSPLEN